MRLVVDTLWPHYYHIFLYHVIQCDLPAAFLHNFAAESSKKAKIEMPGSYLTFLVVSILFYQVTVVEMVMMMEQRRRERSQ